MDNDHKDDSNYDNGNDSHKCDCDNYHNNTFHSS